MVKAIEGFLGNLIDAMTLIDRIAERYIQEAAQCGEFDALPGAGKPLVLEDDSLIPEALRVGYRLLKNTGYLPPELQLTNEIKVAEQLLACIRDAGERNKAEQRLRWMQFQLRQSRGDSVDFVAERRYQDKLLQKL